MTQEAFPEIQAATQALEKQIALTETEIDQMKQTITSKKELPSGWRKAIAAVSPKGCRSEEEGSNPTIVESTHKGVRKWTPFPPSLALHALKIFMELFFPRKRARPVAGCEYCFSFVLT
jgi:hypothetical protein